MDDIRYKNNESSVLSDLRFFSQFICHRIPERTFKFRGYYFPVCSRCTGLYIGAIFFYIYALSYLIDYSLLLLLIALMIILPFFLDGLTQLTGLRESNNLLRFITGILAGFGAALVLTFIKIMVL